MLTYVGKRLLLFIPTMLAVAVATFFLLRVVPGDIVEIKLRADGGLVTDEVLNRERERLGLNRSLAVQFGSWVTGALQGDFGISMWTGTRVIDELASRLPLSVELALLSTFVAVLMAVPLGVSAALFRGTAIDVTIRLFAIAGLATPPFWLGMLVILALLFFFEWVPPIIFVPLHVDPLHNISQMLFPAIVVGFRFAAVATRMIRSSLLDTLQDDFIRTGRAKGLRERYLVWKHAMPNAMLPVVTVVALEFTFLVGGVIVTEQVFNLNGVGRLFLQSILVNDFIVVQAIVFLLAALFLTTNLLVDILYALLDPRIRYS